MAVPTLNFSGRDFSAEYERLLTLLRSELPSYTDLNHSDAGIVILRLLARETDQLNYYIDSVAQEGFIQTALFKQSLIELGRLVDYLPTLVSPASTTILFTRIEGISGAIEIPEHTILARTSDGLTYITTETVEMAAEEDTVSVDAVQGEIVEVEYDEGDFDIPYWTNRPQVVLGTGVASAEILVTSGTEPVTTWSNVDSFWQSVSDDAHFLLELNGDTDEVSLVLGDGVRGQSYPTGDSISVAYLRSDGSDGNCGIGQITTILSGELDESVTCSNTTIATGGAPSETIEELRAQIPAVTRAQRRMVVPADYVALLEKVPGVLHVQAVDRNYGDQWPHFYVALFVVPDGGGPMSEFIEGLVEDECALRGHLGDWMTRYIIRDAEEYEVDVTLTFGLTQGYTENAVKTAINTALTTFFAAENQGIATSVDFGLLEDAVEAVPGVSWVNFTAPSDDVTIDTGQIATLGSVSLTKST
jgi:uncharacterized phage protein gp47/JayE